MNIDKLGSTLAGYANATRSGAGPARPTLAEAPSDQVRLGETPSCAGFLKSWLPRCIANRLSPAIDPAFEATQGPEKDRLVDAMLARSPNAPRLPARMKQHVREELRAVPLDVLRVVDRNHVAVTALLPEQSILDIGVIDSIDLSTAYADPERLARDARAAATPIQRRYERDLHHLEARARRSNDDFDEENDARAMLAQARITVGHECSEAIFEATRGRVELYHERRAPLHGGGMIERLAREYEDAKPVSLRDIAREHGARTPDELARYQDLVVALNGDRVREAQARYARQEGRTSADDRPFADRPFQALDEQILVPSFYFFRDDRGLNAHDDSAPARPISGHDMQAVLSWQSPHTAGQYFYLDGRNTVVVRSDEVGRTTGHRPSTVVHEMGHAYEFSVRDLEPRLGERYEGRIDDTWDRFNSHDEGGDDLFPTEYARTSPRELFADSFAIRLGKEPERLRREDRRWADTVDGFIALSHRIAAP